MSEPDPRPSEGARNDGAPASFSFDSGSVLAKNPAVSERRTLDSVLLLPADNTEPLVLEGAAVTLWDLLDHPVAAADLLRELASLFQLAPDRLRADLEPVIRHLVIVDAVRIK